MVTRRKCSHSNDMETRSSKEEREIKFAIYQKQVKAKLPAENADIP